MLNRQLRAYYRGAMFGNRSTLARSIDFIALRLFIFVALYVWFSLQTAQLTLSAILAGVGVGMVSIALSLYKSIRLDRFVAQKRMELSRDYLFEKIVLLPRHAFLQMLREMAGELGYTVKKTLPFGLLCSHYEGESLIFALQNHPHNKVSPQQILNCYRKAREYHIRQITLVSTAPLQEEARTFLHKIPDISVDIWSRQQILHLAQKQHRLPEAQEVEAALLEELEQRRMSLKKMKQEALYSSRARAYIVCGMILGVASWITGQHIYYPLMAGLCFFLAFVSFFNGQRDDAKHPRSSR